MGTIDLKNSFKILFSETALKNIGNGPPKNFGAILK